MLNPDQMKALVDGFTAKTNAAYTERNRLVAALSKLFPSSLELNPDVAEAANGWLWIVFIDLPTGQCSWHVPDDEVDLFGHLVKGAGRVWDQHTTEEKYRRVAQLRQAVSVCPDCGRDSLFPYACGHSFHDRSLLHKDAPAPDDAAVASLMKIFFYDCGVNRQVTEECARAILAAARRGELRSLLSKGTPRPAVSDAIEIACPDCGVGVGRLHDDGCDIARCMACGRQRISCGCEDHGVDAWAGEYPGVVECRRRGWYSYLPGGGTGWHRCSKDHPGASEDLNRLALCPWDPKTKTWGAEP